MITNTSLPRPRTRPLHPTRTRPRHGPHHQTSQRVGLHRPLRPTPTDRRGNL